MNERKYEEKIKINKYIRNRSVEMKIKNIFSEEKILLKKNKSFIKISQRSNDISEICMNIKKIIKVKKEENKYIFKIHENNNRNFQNSSKSFKLVGLKNIGNSCYMNSILQILFRTPKFLENLRKYYYSQDYKDNPLINSLIELSENPKSITALKMIKREMARVDISYGKNIQNDSQMFGIDLINQIIELMKGEYSSSSSEEEEDKIEETIEEKYKNFIKNSHVELNPFEKMFLFHESHFKIDKNNHYKNRFESWININLEFPDNKKSYSIEELLEIKYINIDKIIEVKKFENNDIINEIQENNISNIYKTKRSYTLEESLFNKFKIFENICCSKNLINNNFSDNKNINDIDDDYSDIYENVSFKNYIYLHIQQFFEKIKSYWKKLSYFVVNKCTNEKTEKNDISKFEINQLASLPKVLIISINRAILGKPFHLNKLSFCNYLNINNCLDKILFENKPNECVYKLYAINECSSLFIDGGGHYISYIKTEQNIWYKFDDESVRIETPDIFNNRNVVGLYYIKI